MKRHVLGILFMLLAGGVATAADEADGEVLRAMKDELARSRERLRMDDLDPPYRIVFTVDETSGWACSATFGALASRGGSTGRRAAVEIRVGDPTLDNTNFVNRYYLTGRAQRVTLADDDDYASVRQRLWLATDGAYKTAVGDLAAKKAWLRTNQVTDRPDDLIVVEPTVRVLERHRLKKDEERMVDLTKRLSAIFRDTPEIQGSRVEFDSGVGDSTILSTDGVHTRDGYAYVRVIANAWTQAEDGMPLGDAVVVYAEDIDSLPDEGALENRVRAMADRLAKRTRAPRAEEYIGPVLFDDEAACFVMLELLADRLSQPNEPLGAGDAGTPFKNRLKKRVTPPFLSIVDDPTLTEWNGNVLLGHNPIDDDGVPGERVLLVDEGRLRSWYMSRIPTREIKTTNGHSVNGSGGPANVIVSSTNTLSRDELRKELIRVAADQELEYAIRVESMARSDVSISGAGAGGRYRNGSISLSSPVAAYRVYLDGREEPIRGGEWQGVTLRTLRDIFVTGDTPFVLNAWRNGEFVSVVCPALLIEELEMKKPAEQEARLPYLDHPYFSIE